MRMYDVIETLTEMLDSSSNDKTVARAQYATAEYLLNWLEEQAVAEKAYSAYLHQKLSEVRKGFRFNSCSVTSPPQSRMFLRQAAQKVLKSALTYILTASNPLCFTMDKSLSAGPPGFFTPRSQSDTRFFETFR